LFDFLIFAARALVLSCQISRLGTRPSKKKEAFQEKKAMEEPQKKSIVASQSDLRISADRKIILFKLICEQHGVPQDIYIHMCLFCSYIFMSLEQVEFEWAREKEKNRIIYSDLKHLQSKKWHIGPGSHGSYEIIQTALPLSNLPQLWVVEVSPGDKWVGIATKGNSFGCGYGCWPETSFTSGGNNYIEKVCHRKRLLIYITIHANCRRIDWELYNYPGVTEEEDEKKKKEKPSEINHLSFFEICRQFSTLEKYETYSHILEEQHIFPSDYYFTIAIHNPEEYVNVLHYAIQ
jgi:hypothetical protein